MAKRYYESEKGTETIFKYVDSFFVNSTTFNMQVSYPQIFLDFDIDNECQLFDDNWVEFIEGTANLIMKNSTHRSKLIIDKGYVKPEDQLNFGIKHLQMPIQHKEQNKIDRPNLTPWWITIEENLLWHGK